ncbi:site-2 protease family protein [Streptomyces litchfieldiae]|uniref:Zinc metalloprotease n=1 Tax=Streptomyces litchfieldiae TaxID=3075543 RepID=A0ABU2MIZ3_9ACTN|nr:site-2 protease family protein [Streptomyces sp. DSM 44938]MDT0341568.1 site-2 protease family protein [Streptomyces sp. DSM 44938]
MRATFSLGRIAGVRVGVHWSVLLIFALIATGLATGRLPEAYPDRAWPLYATAGLGTALVFFASLLAHELAHAVVARRNGVGVDDIVLWLLGGATRMRGEAPNPGAELRIAGSGPLTSLLAGVLFAAVTWLMDATETSGLLVEAAAWLAAINLLLALFNVIPAAPLDGGRLLRALLWWRTGDRLRAQVGAAAAGRVFGWLLLVAGMWWFLWSAWFGGLWLALIGWFLVAAATEEARQARVRELLGGIMVSESMTPDPVTVPARLPVAELLSDRAFPRRHAAFPVTEWNGDGDAAGHPIGLVTADRAGQVPPEERERTTVREIMQPLEESRVVAPDEALADLVPRLEPGAEHRVLVLERGRLVGIVAPSDVNRTVRWLAAARPREDAGM